MQTEDLYSEEQLQTGPLLDLMINRSVWEVVAARGEQAAVETSNMIAVEIRAFLLPQTEQCS